LDPTPLIRLKLLHACGQWRSFRESTCPYRCRYNFCRTTKGLLECPCTDRIVKVLPTAYKAQSVGVCAAAYRATSAAECAAAVTRAALQLSSSIAVTSATGVTTSMPAGCCLSFDLYGALPSLAANRPYQPLPCTHLPLRCPVRCAFCIGSLLSSRYDGGAHAASRSTLRSCQHPFWAATIGLVPTSC
jgi:hypothetical protein